MQITRSLNSHIIWKTLGLGIQLLITVFLSRILGAADSGHFFYFISWLSFFILIGSGGLDSAITYFIASGIIPKNRLLFITVAWLLLVSLILYFLGILYADQIKFLNSFPENGLFYGFIFIVGQSAINYFTAFFYGEQRYVLPGQLIFFGNLAYAILLIIASFLDTAIFTHFFLVKTYIISVAFQGLALAIFYGFYSREKKLTAETGVGDYRKLFSYGFMAFCANVFFFAATRIDYWLLNKFNIPNSDIGNYIQVTRIVQLFQIFPSMLAAYFFPKTAASGDKIIPYFSILIRWVIIINFILLLPVIFAGSYLFPLIFGESFDQMYVLFILLTPGIIALSVLSILSTYLAGADVVHLNLFTAFIAMIIICLGDYYLIPVYGVKAAAAVSGLAYLICTATALLLFVRKTGISIKKIITVKKSDFELLKRTTNFKSIFQIK
jgi:O-antigen/teichoic acid export membrane protein